MRPASGREAIDEEARLAPRTIKILPGAKHRFEVPGTGAYDWGTAGRSVPGSYDVMVEWIKARVNSGADRKARAYGDTVILTGKVVTEVRRGDKDVREPSRYTDTYVKRDGQWQVVASPLSPVAGPKR